MDVNEVSLDHHEATEQIGSTEIQLIQLLHRSTDGFVAFAVGDEDTLLPKIAIRSDTLPEEIPSFTRDSYVSINQAFRLRRCKVLRHGHRGRAFSSTNQQPALHPNEIVSVNTRRHPLLALCYSKNSFGKNLHFC